MAAVVVDGFFLSRFLARFIAILGAAAHDYC
jgi:hypothetical protein